MSWLQPGHRYVFVGGLVGGATGVLLGKGLQREPHWGEVHLPGPQVRVGIAPVRGQGVRVAVV